MVAFGRCGCGLCVGRRLRRILGGLGWGGLFVGRIHVPSALPLVDGVHGMAFGCAGNGGRGCRGLFGCGVGEGHRRDRCLG